MRRYPGLAPFTAEQRAIFFGRDDDIQELSELIFVERKVLLYSKSGYGKTSLLNAGVVPELSKNDFFEFIPIRFRAHTEASPTPHQTFLQAVRQHADFSRNEKTATLLDTYASGHSSNYWAIFKKNQLLKQGHKTYILLFDQFEELFTYPPAQVEEFKRLLSEIVLTNQFPEFFDSFEDDVFSNKATIAKEEIELLYENINIKAVFSMRSDRLSELNKLANIITDIQKVFYELQPLNEDQARRAILEPAKRDGSFDSQPFSYEGAAIDKIIHDLTDGGRQKIETTQLQIVCQRLEENLIEQKTAAALIKAKDIPDFKDLFLDFYDEATAKVALSERENARKFIEDQLIIEGRRVSLDELVCQKYVSSKTLQQLVDNRLLRAEPNSTQGVSYELSHDTLVPPITELAQKRRDLEEKRRLEAKQRQQIRIIAISILVAAASIGASIFTFFLWRKADEQEQIAKAQEQIATDALNELKEEQRLRDSLNFQFYLKQGINQKENSEYDKAIQSFGFALKFDSTQQVIELIEACEELILKEAEFKELLAAGRALEGQGENFYAAARRKYRQARALNVNNQLVDNNILRLEGKIDAFVEDVKRRVAFLIGVSNEEASALLKTALRLKPKDNELKRYLEQTNQ